MNITVFELEVTFFDGCDWKDKTVTITATSKIQLIKGFLEATRYINELFFSSGKRIHVTTKEQQKKLWNDNKRFIEQNQLQFPIIKIH